MDPSELARQFVADALEPITPRRRVSARGKYANSPLSSEDFMRERREENEREERRWLEDYGSRLP